MTFFIVLFIVLMQFLWRYIDDLVGKGLSIDVIGELFFYAAISMVPMALPLAILLASLMTFGNFGEKFELTAMKASGISLIRVMAPLIVLISGIAVGAFFFQNDVLPKAQVKMWTLLFSMKQKSPEVEIPEGVFYDQIPGYNLFVEKKNPQTGMLHKVMIYDVSKGGENASIILTDSARIAFTKDNKFLYLHMTRGEQFENLRNQQAINQNVPFRREQFDDKEVLIPFDANFNRMDEKGMRSQYVGKNIAELQQTIDSVGVRLDSIGDSYSRELLTAPLMGQTRQWDARHKRPMPAPKASRVVSPEELDSMFKALPESQLRQIFNAARARSTTMRADYEFKSLSMEDDKKTLRRHEIELLKKFTLSVACLIFFFIGAPLGAIIRKGGIGTPLVISVLLFLVYYIIDNTGYKMARDGRWVVWFGMWISTFILGPLGVYVTYKAMNDSAVFDKDAYVNLIRRFFGRTAARKVAFKEVIIDEMAPRQAFAMLHSLDRSAHAFLRLYKRPLSYLDYFRRGYDTDLIKSIGRQVDETVAYINNCRDNLVVAKLSDYPVLHTEWVHRPSTHPVVGKILAWFFPLGLLLWAISFRRLRVLKREMRAILKVDSEIFSLLKSDADKK